MTIKSRTYRQLALFQAILILCLVPVARTLQLLIENTIDNFNQLFIHSAPVIFSVLLVIISILVIAYYRRLFRRINSVYTPHQTKRRHFVWRPVYLLTHLACAAGLLFVSCVLIVADIEYTPHSNLWNLSHPYPAFNHYFTTVKALMLTILISNTVNIVDETLQWLHPQRVGDVGDLALNLASVMLGLLLIEPFLANRACKVEKE